MQLSPIEWTHYTANPLRYRDPEGNVVHACIHKSTGCLHCYAETLSGRWGRAGKKFTAENMKSLTPFLDENELKRMLTLKAASGRMCFIGDMTDIFGEWVPFELLDKLFAVFALRPDVIWQVLTKRADRMREYLTDQDTAERIYKEWGLTEAATRKTLTEKSFPDWPLRNVWLGVSAENQKYFDERVELLGLIPAAVRFISIEPMLEDIDTGNAFDCPPEDSPYGMINWVIVGGESGPGARPFSINWARAVVRQCKAAEVPVFVKQLGAAPFETAFPSEVTDSEAMDWQRQGWCRIISNEGERWSKNLGIKDRKGGDMSEWPEDLRVREFPV